MGAELCHISYTVQEEQLFQDRRIYLVGPSIMHLLLVQMERRGSEVISVLHLQLSKVVYILIVLRML